MIGRLSSQSILLAALLLGIGFAASARAQDYRLGALRIEHPWAIATPHGAMTGAGYLKITNEGREADRLIAVKSPAAQKVTLHQMIGEDGMMKMRRLDKLEIKPGETVELKPEGMHLMFEGLQGPLLASDRAKGTLVFEKAGSVDVEFAIVPMGQSPSSHMH